MRSRNTTADQKKTRRKKPGELLSSVMAETVLSTAVEALRATTAFGLPNKVAWVVLRLDVDDIGGLNKKENNRNEAKGSILQLIKSDDISTVVTQEMLDEEYFCIIPTPDTLARMDEFSLLTQAPYSWMILSQPTRGVLETQKLGPATYDEALLISHGTTPLRDAVGESVWVQYGGEPPQSAITDPSIPVVTDTVGMDDTIGDDLFRPQTANDPSPWAGPTSTEQPTASFEEPPVFDDPAATAMMTPVENTTTAFEDGGGSVQRDPFADDPFGGGEAHTVTDTGAEDDPSEDYVDEEVGLATEHEVREAIARRFLSEDLDLVIPLDEFETTFGVGTQAVHITLPDSVSEWLGGQVAQITEQANADLAHLRAAHEDTLRMRYIQLMTGCIEDTIRKVAIDLPGSQYKALADAAETKRAQDLAAKDMTIAARQKEITDEFDQAVARVGEQASLQAITTYSESHRPAMERRRLDVVTAVNREIDDDYTLAYQHILRVRREHAQLQVEVGMGQIFTSLMDQHKEYLAAEQERLDKWNTDITALVDANRTADIARIETLATQQRTSEEVATMRADHEQRVATLQAEHRESIERLTAELERTRADAITAATHRDQQWERNLETEQNRANELARQLATADLRATEKADQRLAEVRADRDAMATALRHADATHIRSNRVLIVLMVALCVLGVAAGFIGGVGFAS